MIDSASVIIRGVPTSHIDPLAIPGTNGKDVHGYIVVSYPDEQCSLDILFLQGNTVTECARMEGDLRSLQPFDALRSRLQAHDTRAAVSFFQVPARVFERFASTFHLEAQLKVMIDSLSPKQIGSLLAGADFTRGILELDLFGDDLPVIDLQEFDSKEKLLNYRWKVKRGWLRLYDIEKNNALLIARVPEPRFRCPSLITPPHLPIAEPVPAPLPAPVPREPPSDSCPEKSDPRSGGDIHPPGHGQEMELFPETEKQTEKPHHEEEKKDPEFVRLFERMLRSFRQLAFECFGAKLDTVIGRAIKTIRLFNPGFDPSALTPATAPLVINLIDEVVRQASLLKRQKIKNGALTLIADVYEKNFEVLEKNGAIDEVELFYYKLKG